MSRSTKATQIAGHERTLLPCWNVASEEDVRRVTVQFDVRTFRSQNQAAVIKSFTVNVFDDGAVFRCGGTGGVRRRTLIRTVAAGERMVALRIWVRIFALAIPFALVRLSWPVLEILTGLQFRRIIPIRSVGFH